MTTTVHSPTAGRRRLRHALRRARDAAGLTQEQVAEAMDWSLSKVIRIETGGVGISTTDLRQLLLLYHIDGPTEVSELVELARIGRKRPWWTRYKEVVPSGYLSYIGLEDESTALRCVSPTGVPGLLQTEEFARALVDASLWTTAVEGRPRPAPAVVGERADLRMIRQREVLHRPIPPEITAVLDEAVLYRQIGGPGPLRRQLLHLLELGRAPHITVQVLPFTAGMLTMVSPFVILEFPDPADTDVVYTEGAFEYILRDDPTDVETYRLVFQRVQAASRSEPESLALIARVAGGLG